jgi:hypothetical protein
MLRCAFMLLLLLAPTAGAEELAPRTRALLHEALEARLTLPTEAPSLQRPLLPQSLPGSSAAAAARESNTAASQAAQAATANRAAQDLASGNGNGNGNGNKGKGGDPSDAARNAAGQARGVESRETGGNSGHGNPHGGPPGHGKH